MFDRNGSRKYLNDAERQSFMKVAKGESDKLQRAFCLTLFYTGCRISEALNLTGERIDLSQKCAVFETLKRRRRGVFRSVPIPESLVTLFKTLGLGRDERIFSMSRATAYRLTKRIMEHAGVEGGMASPKGLRHGFAVACIAKNIPLNTIQKWMGHARLETTAIYMSVSGDEERAFARRLWSV